MSTSLHAERALTARSPAIPLIAGQPALVPLKLEGTEGINSLFHYTLTLQTPDTLASSGTGGNFDLDSFIGLEITCSIELDGMGSFQPGMPGMPGMPGDHDTTRQGAGVREISGLITAARFVREDHRHAVYELEMRPWLYLTTLTTDCRVFQDKTAVEVIEEVLAPYSYAADKRLSERHPPKDYCVQFNETTFEFITRLMQERGINYHFEHSDGVHRLIWSDDNVAFQSTQPELPRGSSPYHDIPYYPLGHKIDREYIHRFERTSRLTSGAFATRDYDPTRPAATLDADASAPRPTANARQAIYLWRGSKTGLGGSDYSQPNAGADKQAHRTEEQGRQLALLRMQHLRQGGSRAHGTGHVRGVVPGRTFTLSKHPHTAANTEYIVLHTRLVVENVDETTQRDARTPNIQAVADAKRLAGHWHVTVDFTVQPTRETLRPDITQPKPRAYGPQPAIVCGPDAETAETNVHTDALGRVKIQFFWDRYLDNQLYSFALVSSEVHMLIGGRYVLIRGKSTEDDYNDVKSGRQSYKFIDPKPMEDRLRVIAQNIKGYSDATRAPEGFCVAGVVMNDRTMGYDVETGGMGFYIPADEKLLPNSSFSVDFRGQYGNTETSLLQRVDRINLQVQLLAAQEGGTQHELRRGDNTINGVPVQEYADAMHLPSTVYFQFAAESMLRKEQQSLQRPFFSLKLELGGQMSGKPSPLGQAQALKVWDTLLYTMRLSPANGGRQIDPKTGSLVPPTKVGQTCPRSGLWEACLPATHPEANHLAGLPQTFRIKSVQAGEPMPEFYARFMFPDTAEAGNAAIAWRWLREG